MIVCLCLGVSDRHVEAAVAAGAKTMRDVSRTCGAGTDCGACRRALAALVEDARGAACAAGDRA